MSDAEREFNEMLRAWGENFLERYGWNILPVRGKIPAGPFGKMSWRKRGYQERFPNSYEWDQFWEFRNLTGIGVILGGVSGGLVDRDFDNEEGTRAYRDWRERYPSLAKELLQIKTSGGYKVLFRAPPEFLVNMSDIQGEYRGSRLFTVLPPSIHKSGVRYQWVNSLPRGGEMRLLEPDEILSLVGDEHGPRFRRIVEGRSRRSNPATIFGQDLLIPGKPGKAPHTSSKVPPSTTTITESTPHTTHNTHTGVTFEQGGVKRGQDVRFGVSLERWFPDRIVRGFATEHALVKNGTRNMMQLVYLRALRRTIGQYFQRANMSEKRRAFFAWWNRSWKFSNTTTDESEKLFMTAWRLCIDEMPGFDIAKNADAASNIELPKCLLKYSAPQQLLLRYYYVLTDLNWDGTFFLSYEDAGRIVNRDRMTIIRWVKRFIKDQVLKLVRKGSKYERRANQYRMLVKL